MPDKIDITKKYKCANGYEARIFDIEEGGYVLGAWKIPGDKFVWRAAEWHGDGELHIHADGGGRDVRGFSLVEIKPRVHVTGWLNIYIDSGPGCYAASQLFTSRNDADNAAKELGCRYRRVCIHLDHEEDIICENGALTRHPPAYKSDQPGPVPPSRAAG